MFESFNGVFNLLGYWSFTIICYFLVDPRSDCRVCPWHLFPCNYGQLYGYKIVVADAMSKSGLYQKHQMRSPWNKVLILLMKVLKAERPDIDRKRSDLLKLQGEFQLRLRHLEKNLLQAILLWFYWSLDYLVSNFFLFFIRCWTKQRDVF